MNDFSERHVSLKAQICFSSTGILVPPISRRMSSIRRIEGKPLASTVISRAGASFSSMKLSGINRELGREAVKSYQVT